MLGQMPIQPGQQGLLQPMQQIPMQSGHQASYQPVHSMPHVQQGQTHPGAQHGSQFTSQHTQYVVHQQNMHLQGPQTSSQHSQHLTQGQQLPHKQEQKMELGRRDDVDFFQGKQVSPSHQHLMQGQQFPHLREQRTGTSQRDDVDVQQVNQAGFSPAQIKQIGTPSVQNLPVGTNSSHTQKMSIHPNQTMQYGGSSANMQHNNSSVQVQQAGADLTQPQHSSRFQTQMGPSMMHGQQQNLPSVGSNMPYEDNHLARVGNEYFYNPTNDANATPHQLPKLAPLPITRNQQVNLLFGHIIMGYL